MQNNIYSKYKKKTPKQKKKTKTKKKDTNKTSQNPIQNMK